jgi:histidine ammonia-lyase
MIPQYVAASLVSENKVLCHPASVDSIPTSAGQEDHVSMGNAAGLKAWQVLENSEHALAIELLAGAQGVEFLAPLEPGAGVHAAHAFVRSLSPRLGDDRPARPGHRSRRRGDPRRLADRRRGGGDRGARMKTDASVVSFRGRIPAPPLV